MFEKVLLREYLKPRKTKEGDDGENCIMGNFIICALLVTAANKPLKQSP
jgi:hypothetical protein